MKVRESGMPDERMWEIFFDVPSILERMAINSSIKNVAEFGCGYGTFTIPTAKIISGRVFALDIEPLLVDRVIKCAKEAGLNNVVGVVRDFIKEGSGLVNESVDYVMLFNIMHDERPARILEEASRILRRGGKIGIIHWNYDPTTPRGPPMDIRPKPEQCQEWARETGFTFIKRCDLKPYHYGLLFEKQR
jgi:SAM-dependent methyltransferase